MANNSLSLPLFSVCKNKGHTLCFSTYINESFYLLDQKKKQVKIKCEVNILSNKETNTKSNPPKRKPKQKGGHSISKQLFLPPRLWIFL